MKNTITRILRCLIPKQSSVRGLAIIAGFIETMPPPFLWIFSTPLSQRLLIPNNEPTQHFLAPLLRITILRNDAVQHTGIRLE